jgi:hypothetical protein
MSQDGLRRNETMHDAPVELVEDPANINLTELTIDGAYMVRRFL